MTDEAFFWDKWTFPPNTTLAPDAYLIVFFDKRNSTEAYLHAPLKIKNVLYLCQLGWL